MAENVSVEKKNLESVYRPQNVSRYSTSNDRYFKKLSSNMFFPTFNINTSATCTNETYADKNF